MEHQKTEARRRPLTGAQGLMASTAAALMLVFTPAAMETQAVAAPMPNPGLQEQPQQPAPPTFGQRAQSGMLDMMPEEEKLQTPLSQWKKYLPAIISHEQYNQIPAEIEAQIDPGFLYKTFLQESRLSLMAGLIQSGQIKYAREEVRHDITPDFLKAKDDNGYMLLADVLRHGTLDQFSPSTREVLLADTELWLVPVATHGTGKTKGGVENAPAGQQTAPAILAARYGRLEVLTPDLQKAIAAHPRWEALKLQFATEAAEEHQLGKLTPPLWDSYTNNDILRRDSDTQINLVDRAALMGQAHFLPDRFWTAAGLEPFVTPNPKSGIVPFYFVVSAADTVRNLSEAQKTVLRTATREHWFHMGKEQHGLTPFMSGLMNRLGDLINEGVWKSLTRKDTDHLVGGGLYKLADWISNAGYAKKLSHLYSAEERKFLAPVGSITGDPASWNEIKMLEEELRKGNFDHDKWMQTNPITGRTNLHTWLRIVPAGDLVATILPRFSLDDLMVAGKDGEFALLSVADGGFLKNLSQNQWGEIRQRPDVLTKTGKSGRFVLDLAAKDMIRQQLGDIPKDVRAALPRDAWFQRDALLGFPFHWAHWSGQEESIPWETGAFRPYDLMVIAPMKADSFTHLAGRDFMLRARGTLKPDEPGPLSRMLKRFPFEMWREKDEHGDTALLKLGRNGGFHYLPGTEKQPDSSETRQQQELQRASNAALYLLPKTEFLDRIETSDLEAEGRYGDTLLYWLAPSSYVEIKGTAVVWHQALELIRPEAVAALSLEKWTQKVRPVPQEELDVNDGIRITLRQESFPLLEMVKAGFLPPKNIVWPEEFYTQREASGNDVVRELFRQNKFTIERLNDLAELGMLTEDYVPRYTLAPFKNARSWLSQVPGEMDSIFAKAASHGQADAADWAPPAILETIPVEEWYKPGVNGEAPAVGMIRHGKMFSVPDKVLYESPQKWLPEMLDSVFGDADIWAGKPENLKTLWKNQVNFIAAEIDSIPAMTVKATTQADKARIEEYAAMLKDRAAMYENFRPVYEKVLEGIVKAMPAPKPRQQPSIPLDNLPPPPSFAP